MPELTRRDALKTVGLGSILVVIPGTSRLLRAADETGKPVTITIYNTGDLHEHSGNLARIAAFVKAAKKKDPHALFVDAGDFLNKGEGWLMASRGEKMMALMAALGYDLCILGNHDYIHGKDRILDLHNKYPKFPLVLCNMKWAGNDVERAKGIPRYKLYKFGDARLCLSGGGSHYKNHAHGPPLPMFHERIGYREILPEIKKKADVFVFVSHLFDSSDRNLINAWKEDAPHVIIGGHTHQTKVWRQEQTLLIKAGCWGRDLGKTTITYDPATKKVTTGARILHVSGDWPEDANVKALREKLRTAPTKKKTAAVRRDAVMAKV